MKFITQRYLNNRIQTLINQRMKKLEDGFGKTRPKKKSIVITFESIAHPLLLKFFNGFDFGMC